MLHLPYKLLPIWRNAVSGARVVALALALAKALPASATITPVGNVSPTYPGGGPDPWIVGSELTVANGSPGALTISAGSDVTSNGGTVAFDQGTIGVVEVTGAGSTWTSTQDIVAGVFGDGELRVLLGGVVESAGGSVGHVSGVGEVTVQGTGSRWTNSGALFIGNSSAGELSILQGGRVVSQNAWIGLSTGATGTATIDGPGSVWRTNSSLTLGDVSSSGDASLTLSGLGSRLYVGTGAETAAAGFGATQTAMVVAGAPGKARLNVYGGNAIINGGSAYLAPSTAIQATRWSTARGLRGITAETLSSEGWAAHRSRSRTAGPFRRAAAWR